MQHSASAPVNFLHLSSSDNPDRNLEPRMVMLSMLGWGKKRHFPLEVIDVASLFSKRFVAQMEDDVKELLVAEFTHSEDMDTKQFIYCLLFHDIKYFAKLPLTDSKVIEYSRPWFRPMLNLASQGHSPAVMAIAGCLSSYKESEEKLRVFEMLVEERNRLNLPILTLTSAFNALSENERFSALGILEDCKVEKHEIFCLYQDVHPELLLQTSDLTIIH